MGAAAVLLDPCGDLLDRCAGAVELVGLEHQERHRTRDGQGVHHDEFPLRIPGQQLLAGGVDLTDGHGHLAGERDEEQILFPKDRLEIVQVGLLVQRAGHGNRAIAHCVVVFLVIQRLTEIVEILLAVDGVGHFDIRDVILLLQVQWQIAVAVRHEDVAHSRINLLTELCLGKGNDKAK